MLQLTRLEEIPSPQPEPIDRLWLVFFSDATECNWWARFFRPGFRHVSAACFYAGQDRWVRYNPTRYGTRIELYRPDEFGPRFQQLLEASAAVVRMRSRHGDRRETAATFYCVGAVKALLGIRSRALSPASLFRDLVRHGAEIVKAPAEGPRLVDLFIRSKAAASRGRGGEAPAQAGAAARRG